MFFFVGFYWFGGGYLVEYCVVGVEYLGGCFVVEFVGFCVGWCGVFDFCCVGLYGVFVLGVLW